MRRELEWHTHRYLADILIVWPPFFMDNLGYRGKLDYGSFPAYFKLILGPSPIFLYRHCCLKTLAAGGVVVITGANMVFLLR